MDINSTMEEIDVHLLSLIRRNPCNEDASAGTKRAKRTSAKRYKAEEPGKKEKQIRGSTIKNKFFCEVNKNIHCHRLVSRGTSLGCSLASEYQHYRYVSNCMRV